MKNIDEADVYLRKHFRDLKLQRDNEYVFLLEHGFSEEEINTLVELLHQELALHDDNIAEILECYDLPFLVIATETGYCYEGNGTGYWPLLEKKLGCPCLDHEMRKKVRDAFALAERNYNIICPPDTDWARQYKFIAWPITNSLLPKDIRLQFLRSIGTLPKSYYLGSHEEIALHLRENLSTQDSQRYKNWLKVMPFVGQLALVFMKEKDSGFVSSWFTPEVLMRIHADMDKDKTNREGFRRLRTKIKENYEDAKTTRSTVAAIPVVSTAMGGLFLICRSDHAWCLKGIMPARITERFRQDEILRNNIRATQSSESRLLGWGELSIKPPCFWNNEPFEIPDTLWSKINTPFLHCSEYSILDSIGFKLTFPAFFRKDGKRVSGIEADSGSVFCVTTVFSESVCGIEIEGESYPSSRFTILRIDTSSESALLWCKSQGIAVCPKPSWNWVCHYGQIADNTVSAAEGAPIFLVTKNSRPVNIYFENKQHTGVSGIISFDGLSTGEHTVFIDDVKWTIHIGKRQPHQSLFNINLRGNIELDVTAMKKRALCLNIESGQHFINFDYSISLVDESATCATYTEKCEITPYTIRLFNTTLLEKNELLAEKFWQLIQRQEDLILHIDIGNIWHQEWRLESANCGIWWVDAKSEHPCPESDGDEVYAEDILHVPGRYPLYPDDMRLYCAVSKNENEQNTRAHGRIYHAESVFKESATISTGTLLRVPERKLRQRKDTEHAIGLENIVTDILAFKQALINRAFARLQHKRILDELMSVFWEITCGERWLQELRKQRDISESDISDELTKQVKELMVCHLEYEKEPLRMRIKQPNNGVLDEAVNAIVDLFRKIGIKNTVAEEASAFLNQYIKNSLQSESMKDRFREMNESDLSKLFTDANNTILKVCQYRCNALLQLIRTVDEAKANIKTNLETWTGQSSAWKETANMFAKLQAGLKGNPYRELWNNEVTKNVFSILWEPSRFNANMADATFDVMLRDRQSMRYISLLWWKQKQMQMIQEVLSNE
ncbi:MAG: hypothetical protein PHQ75_00790 [Thermoguttaceae bacterium]|nr:hypothetical protein [Thermoguttaceae bacterium]